MNATADAGVADDANHAGYAGYADARDSIGAKYPDSIHNEILCDSRRSCRSEYSR